MTEKPTDPETRTASFGAGETLAQPRTGVFDVGEKPGDMVGPFKLLSVLGEGGFGIVWLAERREPIVQRVAVKVIKPGMDSREVVARFEQERQALAVMNHPSIAKVLDAGATANGRPYFVMEFVKGDPITAYCDKNRLTLKQRLELFLPVLDAVQHAHSKGIIHRDLKPSNVLVAAAEGESGIGQPKVIDFGIAKAISQVLTDKTLFTQQGQIVGTPEYMSPEQANLTGIDVDTRTDVYSLGVVLYELLTGVLPFDPRDLRSKGYDEIRRIIREVEPPNPSTRLGSMMTTGHEGEVRTFAEKRGIRVAELERALRSELEWIPLKAMRKERERRYATPSEMAQDIRNYLNDSPLIAGPESRSYRARKFVRKHRLGVGVGALIATTLIAATVVSVRFGLAEQRARREAQTQREIAEEVNRFLNDDLLLAVDPELGGIDSKVIDLLDPAAEKMDERFGDRPQIAARLARTLGEAYLAIGDPVRAKELFEHTRTLAGGAFGPAFDSELASKMAEASFRIAYGESAETAVATTRTRLAEAEKEFGPTDRRTMNLRNQLGGALKWAGELDESRRVYDRTLADRRAALGENDVDTLITRHNINTLALREARAARSADKEKGQALLLAALADRQQLTRDTIAALKPENPQTLATRAEECGLLAESGRTDEAIARYEGVIEDLRKHLGFAHWRTIETTARYGAALKRAGRTQDAILQLTIGLEGTRVARGAVHGETFAITDFYVTCLEEVDRPEYAERMLLRSYADCKQENAEDDAKMRAGRLAEFYTRRNDAANAEKWKRAAGGAP